MSRTLEKYLAVGLLGAAVGGIGGFVSTPFTGPEPIKTVDDGEFVCGTGALVFMFNDGLIGAAIGLAAGLALAWRLPTPGERSV